MPSATHDGWQAIYPLLDKRLTEQYTVAQHCSRFSWPSLGDIVALDILSPDLESRHGEQYYVLIDYPCTVLSGSAAERFM